MLGHFGEESVIRWLRGLDSSSLSCDQNRYGNIARAMDKIVSEAKTEPANAVGLNLVISYLQS